VHLAEGWALSQAALGAVFEFETLRDVRLPEGTKALLHVEQAALPGHPLLDCGPPLL